MSNRWTSLAAAAVVMLTIGAVYSWGIFTQPLLVAYRWDLTTTTWAYAIANFSLAAVGTVIGGFWQDKAGPRTVALAGVSLWGLGNMLAGLGTSLLGAPGLYLTYGIIGGVGAGMAWFGTMPSFNASCFGTKFMGLNYALILSAWGFAGLTGPILIARAKDLAGSFAGILPMIAIVLAVSVILPYLTKKPPSRTDGDSRSRVPAPA